MKGPSRITTERLILRQPVATDAAAIYERYARDPEVTKFMGWPRHRSIEDTLGFLQFSAAQWERWPAGPYLIVSRADHRVLGSTGFGFQSPHEAETGYILAADAWGQGIATEAFRAMLHVADDIQVHRLIAVCHPSHERSQRVLLKCGFSRDVAGTRQMEFPNLAPGVQQEAWGYERRRPVPPNPASAAPRDR